MYEALPLFLLVTTLREGVALAMLTVISVKVTNALGAGLDDEAWMALSGNVMLWVVFLPCLMQILRRPHRAPE